MLVDDLQEKMENCRARPQVKPFIIDTLARNGSNRRQMELS